MNLELPTAPTHQMFTLWLPDEIQQTLEQLRQRWYPPHFNNTPAHCSFFYRLPVDHWSVHQWLAKLKDTSAFSIHIKSVQLQNNGVAYEVESAPLMDFRQQGIEFLHPILIAKDKRPYKPHITLQQRVTAWKAMQSHRVMSQEFIPITTTLKGLNAWWVQKEKWTLIDQYPFVSSN